MSFGDGISWDHHVDEIFDEYGLDKIYYSYQAESPIISNIMKHFVFPHDRDAHLLDCGCHVGRWCNYFQDAGFQYTGVDQSAYALTKAREHTDGEYHHSFLWEFDIPQKFDVAVFVAVMQHNVNRDKPRILQNVRNHMRDRGILFFTESTVEEATATQLTREGWIELAASCGFELVDNFKHEFYIFRAV